jgi:hypothetical protein
MQGKNGLTSRLERGTTDEETIDIGLLAELTTVLLVDTAAVQDPGLLGDLVADALEPVTDGLVHLLSLLSGGDLASANGPDRLVGNDDLTPVRDLGLESLQLLADDLNGLASLTLLEGLAAAPDDTNAGLSGDLGLGSDEVVGLVEDGAALGVAEDGPGDVAVLELGDGDLAGVGTVGLVEDVLGGDLDAGAEVLTDEEEIEGRRGDDDLCSGSEVSICLGRARLRLNLGSNRPVFGSRSALFRLLTISLMDEIDPFLLCNQSAPCSNATGFLDASNDPEADKYPSRCRWWGVFSHLEVAADEELASHDD